MKRQIVTLMGGLMGGLMLLAGVGCGSNNTTADMSVEMGVPDMAMAQPDMATDPRIARGTYLVNNVGLCAFCHTPANPDGTRDQTRAFSGVDCLVDIVPDSVDPMHLQGCISSAHLTPDDATGLKSWTDQNILDVFGKGVDKNGKNLSWVMPWWLFHNMSMDDKLSVIAFLRSLPPVSHKQMDAQPPWNMMPSATAIDESEIPQPSASFTGDKASALRGRYLAAETGLCLDCHTPDAVLPMGPPPDGGMMAGDMGAPPPPWKRPIDLTMPLAGGRHFTNDQLGLPHPPYPVDIWTANLTPDKTGLMGWSQTDIINAFTKGVSKDKSGVCAATHGNNISPYAGLLPQDQMDIANYVMSLPPIANMRPMDCMGPPWP